MLGRIVFLNFTIDATGFAISQRIYKNKSWGYGMYDGRWKGFVRS